MTTKDKLDMSPSPALLWTGRALSALVTIALVVDAAVDLAAPSLLSADMQATGFPPNLALPLGLIILVCAILYGVPQTKMLGAILVTAFLGGAICTHFRLGEMGSPPQIVCLLLAAMAWGGLYLRDARVRALLPLTT